MSRLTTALLVAGPRSVGPWDDRIWRIALHASLVEGGSAAYWIPTPETPPLHIVSPSEVVIEDPDVDGLLDTTLLMLASQLGGEQVEAFLIETHNMTLENGVRRIAKFWELLPDTRDALAGMLSSSVRLGVTIFDDLTLFNDQVVLALRDYGFDLDTFSIDPLRLDTPVQ